MHKLLPNTSPSVPRPEKTGNPRGCANLLRAITGSRRKANARPAYQIHKQQAEITYKNSNFAYF
ncbi:MAG: hypothetical protein CSA76_01830 [Spirochaetales bacterium]|nr:MAG: hypothetical protein CSA76_01830 [Spirochaetales bacterium]